MPSVVLVSSTGLEFTVSKPESFVDAVYSRGALPKIGSIADNYATLTAGGPDPAESVNEHVTLGDLQASSSPAGLALRAAFVRPRGARLIAVGDSITASDSSGSEFSGTGRYANMDSWFTRACALSGQRLRWDGNAAISGQTSTQQLASFQAQVIDRSPDYAVLMVGSNDVNQGISIAQTRTNLTAMMDQARSAGIGLILCSLLPRSSHDPTRIAGLNVWLRDQAARRGAIWVDFFSLLIDPATGDPLAGMTRDGTHPTAAARVLMAQEFIDTVLPHITPWTPPVGEDNTEAGGINLLANPLMLGTPNANGEAPSWGMKIGTRTNQPVTTAVVDRAGWLGKAQEIVMGASPVGSFMLGQSTNTGFAVGDRLGFAGRFDAIAPDAASNLSMYLVCHSATNGGGSALASFRAVANLRGGDELLDGTFWMDGVVPAGTLSLGVYAGTVSTAPGTLRFGQMAVRNLTALGVTE